MRLFQRSPIRACARSIRHALRDCIFSITYSIGYMVGRIKGSDASILRSYTEINKMDKVLTREMKENLNKELLVGSPFITYTTSKRSIPKWARSTNVVWNRRSKKKHEK